MPTSNPTEILLAHDRWATDKILLACEPLTVGQLHHRFEMGPGSLHDTTTHILSAMRRWTDVLAGRELRPFLEGTRAASELRRLLDEIASDFAFHVNAHPFDGLVIRERDGKSYTLTRGGMLTHVATHGMHHRAQCLNMLRHLGVQPLPPSSVMEWMVTADKKS